MNKYIIEPNNDELTIINNNINLKYNKHPFYDYNNKVCIKPWGHEFLIYQNNKIGIWYLKINNTGKTSLHTHFNKDTFIIVIKGSLKIELIDDIINLNEMDYLFIPHYKFHSIGSFSPESYMIEIEVYNDSINFTDKNDLLRINDIYNRNDNNEYNKSIICETDNLENYNYFFINNDFKKYIHNVLFQTININKNNYRNFKYTFNILLDGTIFQNGYYISPGSLIELNDNTQFLNDYATILSLKHSNYEYEKKIIYNNDHLKLIVSQLKNNEKQIILTSGCFDIIHVGHINNLLEAKQLGDILMVCLSSDEQIKKLKGDERPINNYKDRIDLFKTIKYVDYIILYDESDISNETSLGNIMKIVEPSYWVKGSDYNEQNIIKKHPYLKKIKLIDNIPNKSTTCIVSKIKNTI
jgi:rfaE bifunctional protein nucleotidyltransferase chain/domain